MNTATTLDHKIVSKSEWLKAAADFLTKEKELSRLSDEVSRQRRELPWHLVSDEYVFDGPSGKVKLADLFHGRSQLVVYHFMLGPDWAEGCPGCSYVTDHLDGALEHLRARDVSLVLVSRAPRAKLVEFEKRMGWHLPWYSSGGSTFNRDFGVSFTKEEVESGAALYNLETRAPYDEENPGLSVFYKDASGAIFHTYSTYARGLDTFLGAYMLLDRVPKGRDEAGLPMSMAWLRHHDKYEPTVHGINEKGTDVKGDDSCCHHKDSH